jgi:Raf kinase inhibitor-like YbhB/YbcL family protein
MKLTSSAFVQGEKIPAMYTCDGDNVNPPLEITGVPLEAKSLVLIMDDPDVPKNVRKDGMWDHWVVFNIPPDTHTIEEASEPEGVAGHRHQRKNRILRPLPPGPGTPVFFQTLCP